VTDPATSSPSAEPTLQTLVQREAPIGPRRAAAIVLAVARRLHDAPGTVGPSGVLAPGRVRLHADGSASIEASDAHDRADGPAPALVTNATPSSAAGAAVGRLLFELLVGRPPLDRADALESAVTASLAPHDAALLARSCSDLDGQWPELEQWIQVLVRIAGGQATDPTPAERSASRRRRTLLALGVALLVAVSVAVILLAPLWWDAVNAQG
jgi:hypothetical protein